MGLSLGVYVLPKSFSVP